MVDSTLYQLLILFLLFYLFLIRPEMKKAKKHQAMLDALQKGDKIVTRGGLYATITKVANENEFLAEIADGVVVVLNKAGVLMKVEDDVQPAAPKAKQPAKKAATKTKTAKTKKQ